MATHGEHGHDVLYMCGEHGIGWMCAPGDGGFLGWSRGSGPAEPGVGWWAQGAFREASRPRWVQAPPRTSDPPGHARGRNGARWVPKGGCSRGQASARPATPNARRALLAPANANRPLNVVHSMLGFAAPTLGSLRRGPCAYTVRLGGSNDAPYGFVDKMGKQRPSLRGGGGIRWANAARRVWPELSGQRLESFPQTTGAQITML
eukprot:4698682-Pyramimonas_sp.AAC.1